MADRDQAVVKLAYYEGDAFVTSFEDGAGFILAKEGGKDGSLRHVSLVTTQEEYLQIIDAMLSSLPVEVRDAYLGGVK